MFNFHLVICGLVQKILNLLLLQLLYSFLGYDDYLNVSGRHWLLLLSIATLNCPKSLLNKLVFSKLFKALEILLQISLAWLVLLANSLGHKLNAITIWVDFEDFELFLLVFSTKQKSNSKRSLSTSKSLASEFLS